MFVDFTLSDHENNLNKNVFVIRTIFSILIDRFHVNRSFYFNRNIFVGSTLIDHDQNAKRTNDIYVFDETTLSAKRSYKRLYSLIDLRVQTISRVYVHFVTKNAESSLVSCSLKNSLYIIHSPILILFLLTSPFEYKNSSPAKKKCPPVTLTNS
jgi:hypothetical protein